eukprot:1159440-Pelagomonas_calceolata.AAC.3
MPILSCWVRGVDRESNQGFGNVIYLCAPASLLSSHSQLLSLSVGHHHTHTIVQLPHHILSPCASVLPLITRTSSA